MTDQMAAASQSQSRLAEFRQGWPVILGAAMGVGAGMTGMVFYTLGLFFEPLAREFGWSRGALSQAPLFLTGSMVFLAPLVGRLSDRVGVRWVGLVSLVGAALALAIFTQIGPGVWTYHAGWILFAVLAAGTIPVVWTRAVNAVFDRARGLALGFTLTGTGVAAAAMPPFVGWLIDDFGWRGGYLGMAAFILAVAVPVVWVFFRAGTGPAAAAGRADDGKAEPGMALPVALRQTTFWMIGVGFLLISFGIGGLIVHMPPILRGAGLSAQQAGAVAGLLGLTVIGGRLAVGFLVDRFHAPLVAFVFLCCPIASCLLLADPASVTAVAPLAILLLGLAAGAEVDLVAYLTSRYFGMRAYGEIYGYHLAFFAAGAGLGPFTLGTLYDATGGYATALYLCAGLFLIGATLIGLLGRPSPLATAPAAASARAS